MKPDLKVNIAGVELPNPIMTASGCCGYGEELADIFPLSKLGAIVTKSITLAPRLGHPPPRTAEVSAGMLNAIGLANVGVDSFIAEKLPWLAKQNTRVVVNVAGTRLDEYVEICTRLNDVDHIDMLELNISCPNVDHGGMEFGADPTATERAVKAIKKVFDRPVMAKLSPNVTDIRRIAAAAEQGGADAISLINSVLGTSIDIYTWKPRLTNNKGGLTGPCIKPIALTMVDAVYNTVKVPIVGIGGITTWSDVVEFMLCGASAVQIGTGLFISPDTPLTVLDGLTSYLSERKLKSVQGLIGGVRKY